jgi:hypothetical protein
MRVGLGVLIMAAAVSAGAFGEPQDMGIPPHEAVKRMTLPPGFKAHLFAGEPDIMQPNAFCIDDRGRLWVAQNFTYTGPGGPTGSRAAGIRSSSSRTPRAMARSTNAPCSWTP